MPNTLTQEYLKTSAWKPDLFNGKVAFITGGAGTICRVQAEALVLLGANVAIIGRREEVTKTAATEIATLRPGAKVIGIGNVDVRSVQSIQKAVATTVEQLGKIDFVIAGAAGNFLSPFNQLSANAFKSVIDIDLVGSYNTVKATFEELRKSKGSLIFISASMHYTGVPLQTHAAAAKAGVDALSNNLSIELGPLGIRSNVITPGPIGATEGLSRLVGKADLDKVTETVPLGRLGNTQDIADATIYLFSPAASYVTGTTLVVDGAHWRTSYSPPAAYPKLITEANSGTPKI